MLKAEEEIFLNDRSVEWLTEELQGIPLAVENQGRGFLEAATGLDLEGEDCE